MGQSNWLIAKKKKIELRSTSFNYRSWNEHLPKVESSDAYFANTQNATLNIKHRAEFYFLFFSHDMQWVFAGHEKYGKKIAHWIFAFQNTPSLAEEKFHWIRCPPNTLEIFCKWFIS